MASRVNPRSNETVKAKAPDRKVQGRKLAVEGRKGYEDKRKYPSDRPGPLGRR